MLPEQRGILSSLKSWLRGSTPSRKSGKWAKQRHRCAHLEALEPRQVLTATIYVDFGDRLGTEAHTESEWLNLGLTVPQNQASWIQGPVFPYAGNPTVTYTPFRMDQDFPIDFGPNFGGEPWEFETGPEPPISKEAAAQLAVVQTLQRMFAPFNIRVTSATATNLADVRNTLASNNRLTDPYETLKDMPSADMYNLTNANPAGLQPRGFNPLQVDPVTGAPVGMKDVYIFVGNWTIDFGNGDVQLGATAGDFGFGNLGFGPAFTDPVTRDPINQTLADPLFPGVFINYSDGAGAVCADTIRDEALAGKTSLISAIATVAAQEAGYSYGLVHTQNGEAKINNPFFDPDVDLLSSSDMMREGRHENVNDPQPSLDDVAVFSRIPLMVGDLNQDPAIQQSAYDILVSNPDVGPNTGTALNQFFGQNVLYVTGTGASDRITITPDLTNPLAANVTVDTYRTGEMLPADLINSFTYSLDFTLPAGALSNALFIDAGRGDDQIEIDPTIAGLVGTSIEIFGGGGKDNISFAGTGTEDVAIAVANLDSFRFTQIEQFLTQIQIGQFVATLFEFNDDSTIHLENFNSLAYNLPQFLGANFSVTAQQGSNLAIPPAGNRVNMVIDGTAGPTQTSPQIGVANVEFTNITSVSILNLVGLTADTLSISSDLGFADGLTNFEAGLGPGDDSLILTGTNFALPVAGGVFIFDGGAGKDTISATGDTDWTLINGDATTFTDGMLICGGGGTITLQNMIGDNAIITGGASANAITIESWSGDLTLAGLGGNDTFTIGTATSSVSGKLNVQGGTGDDTFQINNWSGSGVVSGGAGNDTFNATTLAGPDITLDGGANNDTFEIGTWTGDLGALVAGTGNDTVHFTSLDVQDFTLDAGAGNDTVSIPTWTGETGSISGGDGNDTFTIPSVTLFGAMTLDLGIGNDSFTGDTLLAAALDAQAGDGDDTIAITAIAVNGIINGEIRGDMALDLGAGNDSFITDSLGAFAFDALGGDGGDTFTINFLFAPTVTMDGGSGNDTFSINTLVASDLSLLGGSEDDVFDIKTLSATTFSIDGGTGVDRFEMDAWGGTGSVLGGDGDDIFHIKVPANLNVAIDGGNDNDTFDINSWLGKGSVAGGAGNDTFNVNSLTGSDVSLDGGTGNDTFNLNSLSGLNTTVAGGDGIDTFNVKDWSGTGTIAGGIGNDVFIVTKLTGNAGISGDDGSDSFTVTDWAGGGSASGGAGDDTFQITDWSGTGVISGDAGNDIFNATKLSGANVALDGGANDDKFDIGTWTGAVGSLVGGTGNDTVHINSLGALDFTLNAGAGNDNVSITSWNGDKGSAIAGDGDDTFAITTIAITGALTLDLGTGNDSFKTDSLGALSLNALGGSGDDTFAITSITITGAMTLDLGIGKDSFKADSLAAVSLNALGGSDDDVFDIKSLSATTFSIDGGAGVDRFEMDTWTGAGSVLGGDGNDIFHVKVPAALNVAIDGGNDNDTFDINSWLGTGSVAGGAGNDTFNINLLTAANFTLDAGTGTDTIRGTGDTDWTLIDGSASTDGMLICGGGVITLKNAIGDTAIITGGAGNNAIKVDSWSGDLTVNGLGGNDTLTIGTATTMVSGKLTALGGTGNDTFQINNWSGTGSVSGEAGNDNFLVVASANIAGNPAFSGGANTDSFTLDDSLLSSEIDYFIGDLAITSTLAGFAGVDLSGFENVTVNGSQGANTFNVSPSFNATFHANGNGVVGGQNVLNVDFTNTTTPRLTPGLAPPGTGNGAWTFSSGHQPVIFTKIGSKSIPPGFPENAFLAVGSSQGKGSRPLIKVYDSKTNALLFSFYAYETSFTGGVRVAIGDVTGDGVDDIVAAPGPGRAGLVKVFDGRALFATAGAAGKAFITSPAFASVSSGFYSDGKTYKSGLYVAAADVDGDGAVDVVTSTQTGAGKIRVFAFDGAGFVQSRSFTPYTSAEKVKTGAVVTTADVDGDGQADIITAPGGAGTAAIVKVFDGLTKTNFRKFNGFESSFKNGVSIAAADLDGDGLAEIMVGAGTNGKSRVRVLNGSGTLLKEFKAFTSGTINAPLRLATHDVDGQIELFVAQNYTASSHKIRHFDPLTGALVDSLLESDAIFKVGVNLG
jgi:hypothetical protein